MVDTCTVTLTARNSRFAVLPGQVIVFRPSEVPLIAGGSTLTVRTTETVVASGIGGISVDLVPGPYVLETQNGTGLVNVPMVVPDVATATIDDCINSASQQVYSALQVALLAATNGRIFDTAAEGTASPAVAVNDYFLASASGVLSLHRKTAGVAVLIGPLFPQGLLANGSVGVPSLAFANDLGVGLFRPAAGQLGFAIGGALRMLLSAGALNINVPVTGTAVQTDATDATAGRLMKVGAFGLGTTTPPLLADANAFDTPAGNYYTTVATLNNASLPASPYGFLRVWRFNAATCLQEYTTLTAGAFDSTRVIYTRKYNATTVSWEPWYGNVGQPKATTAAGEGQFVNLAPAVGTATVLPAGGTWAYSAIRYTSPGGLVGDTAAGVAAGGTTLFAALAGSVGRGFAWRIT